MSATWQSRLVQPEDPVKLHACASFDMVQHYAVFYLSYDHLFHLQKLEYQCHPNEFAVTHLLEISCARIIIDRD